MADKVALVTGAANGIGKASAKRLARDGIAIGVLDLLDDAAAEVAREIETAGGRAIALRADVTDRASIDAAVVRLGERFGAATVVVNNAGICNAIPFLEMDGDQWDRMMTVNLKSAFLVTQAVLPGMIAANWGRIVNIASGAAQSGAGGMAHYAASKGGMIAMTRSLALEFGSYGITANVIPPHTIRNTAMFAEFMASRPAAEMMQTAAPPPPAPIARMGEPEDIAGAVAYLASDEAGYVTGQVLGVNGGRYI